MYFLLTIDTEADNQWDHGSDVSVRNIEFVPRFQNLCEKHHIKPTYLVTSEVCEDGYAKELFNKMLAENTAEIGAHLHSWTTAPFIDQNGFRYNDQHHAFATELPAELFEAKLTTLSQQIEDSFGQKPTSFRSGRYGFDESIGRTLVKHGFIVDSSVTPFTNWKHHKGLPGGAGGINFMQYGAVPFQYSFPEGTLLEIPITILPTMFPLNISHSIARKHFNNIETNLFNRLLRKLLFQHQPIWMRPFNYLSINSISKLLHEAQRQKLPFLVMMFHSSELMPGGSIYRKNESDIDELFQLLENTFEFINKKGIQSRTLTEAARLQGK